MTTESVKVIVRSRPLLGQELKNRCRPILQFDRPLQQVTLRDPHSSEDPKDAPMA